MKFSIPMRLRAEADLPAAIAPAAEKQRTKPAEWMRRKLREAVEAEGITLAPGGGDEPPGFRAADGQPLPMAAGMGR